MTVFSHPPSFSVSPIEEKTERPPFWHNWGVAERPQRTRLPGCT
jgi:hypothetical protein